MLSASCPNPYFCGLYLSCSSYPTPAYRGIAAGLHQGLSAEEVSRISIDCKADVIVVESEALLKKVLLVQHKLPELKCIVQWRGEPPLSDQRRLAKSHKKHILS